MYYIYYINISLHIHFKGPTISLRTNLWPEENNNNNNNINNNSIKQSESTFKGWKKVTVNVEFYIQ